MKIFLPIVAAVVTSVSLFASTPGQVKPNPLCINMNEPAKNDPVLIQEVLGLLNPPCWMNWYAPTWGLDDPSFVPMVWKPNADNLADAVRLDKEYPDRIWLIGNEPENVDQINMGASEFAQIMKDNDLPEVFACCGNAIWYNGIDSLGVWQEEYLASGGPVPDYWSFTLYGVSTPTEWDNYLRAYFEWWAVHGHGRPIIIHETNCMYFGECNPDLLRHVQGNWDKRITMIFWFAAIKSESIPSWNSHLLTIETQPMLNKTELGEIYNKGQ